jgi:very-short-patch-repair endonuclease
MKTFSHYKNTPKYITDLARQNRRKPTQQEEKLWSYICNKKLNGWKFRQQYPIGRYIVDFYNHDQKLVIEVDGEIHESTQEYDKNKDNYLIGHGYKILRFKNNQIDNTVESVLKSILENLQ